MPIAVQICSREEWLATTAILNLESLLCDYSFGQFAHFPISGADCIFYFSGPAKTRAAAACQYAIDHWSPSRLLNLGTCGAVREELQVLDIILAEKTVQYDCIDRMGEQAVFYEPMTTVLDLSGVEASPMMKQVRQGVIGTADQDLCPENLAFLRRAGIDAVDWESGAIAKICEINKIPCLILRGVSDRICQDQTSSYFQNTPRVMARLLTVLRSIIPFEI